MINDTAPASGSTTLSDSILAAAEQKIESGLLPANRADYNKIVVAGNKVALAKGPNGILASIKNSKDPVNDCAKGAVNLVFLLRKQTRGTMPVQALVPAGMTLMLHALDFVDKIGLMKIGTPELVQATHTFTNMMFRNLGISPQMLAKAHESVENVAKDPAHLEAMKQKAGIVKSPNSSTPTSVPDTGGANGV
jgi:hypothetical protein